MPVLPVVFFGAASRGVVGARNRMRCKLVDGMLWQIERVQSVLGDALSVRGILCFVEADWPLVGGHFSVRGVRVAWPRRLPKELLQTVPPTIDAQTVARVLASAFPPA